MIADKRADALVSNFVGQWLQLRNLESKVRPDILTFPDFDDNIREAFRRETELLFSYILRENRSALELLSADYTFVNERLARHYGIPGVYGTRFRKVPVTDPNRRGLLGHGSILSMTSVATRTSPVFRGKFMLTTFLNTPPPPPLPNVPSLEESAKGAATKPKTVREQLELHREQPDVRRLPSRHRPGGLRAREVQPGRAVADDRRGRRAARYERRAGGRLEGGRPGGAAERHPEPAGGLCHDADRANDDLRARPRRRAVGYGRSPPDRQKLGATELLAAVDN